MTALSVPRSDQAVKTPAKRSVIDSGHLYRFNAPASGLIANAFVLPEFREWNKEIMRVPASYRSTNDLACIHVMGVVAVKKSYLLPVAQHRKRDPTNDDTNYKECIA